MQPDGDGSALLDECFQMAGPGFSVCLPLWLRWLLAPPWLGRIVPGYVGFHLISSESWAPMRMYRSHVLLLSALRQE